MPESVCMLRKNRGGPLETLLADCNGENPKVECDCCTGCNLW